MSIDTAKRRELGAFLRARRAELTPESVGLGRDGRRRVPGLRREEVADLAYISTEYYTRLEQGRTTAAPPVLDALAGALRLDSAAHTYLRALGLGTAPDPATPASPRPRPALAGMVAELTDFPALVLGRRLDVLAWNPSAAALMIDFGSIPPKDRNYVRLLFTEPRLRVAFTDWSAEAHATVAFLRMHACQYLNDPVLRELVGELSERDPDFRRWWQSTHVIDTTSGSKTFRTTLGDITVDWEILSSAADPDQQLIIMSTPPKTPSHTRLTRLTADYPSTGSTPMS